MPDKSYLVSRSCILLVLLCMNGAGYASDPFTIVALPDTQNYVNSLSNTPLFLQQTQWIADQVQIAGNPRNIQFVTHLGDVVSSGDNLTQLQRADAALDTLDGVIEYSVLPGNHDYADTGNKTTGTADYLSFFGPQRFAGESWFGGSDPSGNNSYQRFSAGGYDFIHLALEWQPTVNAPFRETSPIEWAQSVLDANPNTPFIVSTHENIDDDPPGRSGAGQALWDELVRFNDQIFMVLNGHFHSVGGTNDGEYHQVSLNEAGRTVFEVLSDYQDYPNGGDGWLRLMNFDIPNNQIEFETFSPVLNQFQTETVAQVGQFASQFELSIDFADRLNPVFIPKPEPPPEPDFSIQQGVNGYSGTRDKELRSSGGDSANGQDDSISVDGDDGSPGLQPNHGLIAFDDIVGTGANQIPQDAEIEQATLVLEVINPGSGFTVHELLVAWDENSTWQGFGNGVQANDVEAVSTAVASVGANTSSSSNVPIGTLEIDVTSTIEAYQSGDLVNHGWALLPFPAGTNGLDFYTSEFADVSVRPALTFDLVNGDADNDGDYDVADLLILQRTGSPADLQDWEDNFGTTSTTQSSASVATPEPAAASLLVAAVSVAAYVRRRTRP